MSSDERKAVLFGKLKSDRADRALDAEAVNDDRVGADLRSIVFQITDRCLRIGRQQEQIGRMEKLEAKLLPPDMDYALVPSLREEAREKLAAIQACRLPETLSCENRDTPAGTAGGRRPGPP